MRRAATDLEQAWLARGSKLVVQSADPDGIDIYELSLTAEGCRTLECELPGMPAWRFRADFTAKALENATGVMAVTQNNPVGRSSGREAEDGRYHGDGKPRGYTFEATTPPFLLSRRQGLRVQDHERIEVFFHDFLSEGSPLVLEFRGYRAARVEINGKARELRVAHYEATESSDPGEMDVIVGTRLVVHLQRDDEFEMNLLKVQTAHHKTRNSGTVNRASAKRRPSARS